MSSVCYEWLNRGYTKTGYLQIRTETLEGPKAGPSCKIRVAHMSMEKDLGEVLVSPINCQWTQRSSAGEDLVHRLWGYKGPGITRSMIPLQRHRLSIHVWQLKQEKAGIETMALETRKNRVCARIRIGSGEKPTTKATAAAWGSKWCVPGFTATRIHLIKNFKLEPGSPNPHICVFSTLFWTLQKLKCLSLVSMRK